MSYGFIYIQSWFLKDTVSKQMMTGQKADLFILDLFFLGWIILGLICCGIGILFVLPYPQATKVEVYLTLRDFVKILLSIKKTIIDVSFNGITLNL